MPDIIPYIDKRNLSELTIEKVHALLPLISKHMERHFIGQELQDLNEVLIKLSFKDIDELCERIFNFFTTRIPIESFDERIIEEIDLKNLAYDFANELKITSPFAIDAEEKQRVIDLLLKLGRIFLHQVAVPIIASRSSRHAVSFKNLLKRTIGTICIIEGINRKEAFELLSIEELPVETPIGYLPPFNVKEAHTNIVIENVETQNSIFLICHLSEQQKKDLAYTLYYEYQVFNQWKPFHELIGSYGKYESNIIVNKGKIRLLLRVIFVLHRTKTPTKNRFLVLNNGKGFWEFLQQYILSDTEAIFDRELRKISSETNTLKKHESIRNEADQIVSSILEGKNKLQD